MADVEELVEELRVPAGEPAGALVLLHGRGTSEQDLAPLLDVFDPRERLVGAFPRGPLQLPPIGHHWYAVQDDGQPDAETFLATFERLQSWLDGLAERTGVPIERTVLGGFSQGAVMAWALGLGPGRPRPAGILAMSGALPAVPGFVLGLDGPRRAAGRDHARLAGPADRRRARPGRARPRRRRRGRRRLPRDRRAPHHRPARGAGPRQLARRALLGPGCQWCTR